MAFFLDGQHHIGGWLHKKFWSWQLIRNTQREVMMAQYQSRLQGPGLPRGAAIATVAPRTSTALMEQKTRDILPARGGFGSDTNTCSSSSVKMPMDEKLCQLIQKVLELPDGSEGQQRELGKLLQLVPNLPGIYKSLTPTIEQQDGFNRALVDLSGCKKKGTVDGLRDFTKKIIP